MKVAKVVGGGCLGLIVLVGLIVTVVFYATSGITDTADEFFAAANDGDYAKAHSLTAQRLQAEIDPEGLGLFLQDNSLDQVTETSWSSRSINNDRGELNGTVTTASGGAIPVSLELINEQDEWRISFIDVDTVGLESSGD